METKKREISVKTCLEILKKEVEKFVENKVTGSIKFEVHIYQGGLSATFLDTRTKYK